jgi:3-oxoacyl-[acyl-carrier-protein] synthase II
VDLDYGTDLTAKEARRMDKVHQYAICAGKRALRDANLWGEDLEKIDKTRCGVLVGSAMGGMQVYEDNVVALKNKGVKKMSPFTVPYMLTNMSGAILGMQKELGFRGPNYAVNTACATSKCVRSRPRHVASSNRFLSFCRVYSTWCCAGKQPFLFGQSFSFFLPRSLHAARRRR